MWKKNIHIKPMPTTDSLLGAATYKVEAWYSEDGAGLGTSPACVRDQKAFSIWWVFLIKSYVCLLKTFWCIDFQNMLMHCFSLSQTVCCFRPFLFPEVISQRWHLTWRMWFVFFCIYFWSKKFCAHFCVVTFLGASSQNNATHSRPKPIQRDPWMALG